VGVTLNPEDAGQTHDEPDADTEMFVVPPAAVAGSTVGLIVNEQPDPNWVTVNTWPFTVIVALRAEARTLRAALNRTRPGPVPPVVPEFTVSQDRFELTAVHAQFAPVATPNEPVPPDIGRLPA